MHKKATIHKETIVGEKGETTVRIFSNETHQIFQRGQIDTFIMTVPKSLGPLNYIHIWHDNQNSQSSSSWFLKYMIIYDLQTLQKSYFICQKWFSIMKDDGQIERILPIAGDLQKSQLSHILSKHAYYNISDNHLWFSIFLRPQANIFTR
ncbi:unnamed protein product, partial [Adineta steineri]